LDRNPDSEPESAPADAENPSVAKATTSNIESHLLFPTMRWGIGAGAELL